MSVLSFENKQNEEEKRRELEIQSILEETHYLTDQEKMEKTAERYRAKPVMDDIFSNASKKKRLTNDSPLEIDKKSQQNTIVGEKTAATMQASLMLDGNNDDVKTPEEAKAQQEKELEKKKNESELDADIEKENDEKEDTEEKKSNEIVTLSPEYDENTDFAKDVINDVEQFSDERPHIESIHSIDIDIEDDSLEKQAQRQKELEKERYEELINSGEFDVQNPPKKVISKVPVYRFDESAKTINVKAGKFAEVVEYEYEQYIRSKNPSVIAHVIKPEPKVQDEDTTQKDTRSTQEKILSAVVGFFSKDESDDDDMPQEKTQTIEDYTGEDDEKSIVYELNLNIKKLFVRSIITGVVALLSIILTVVTRIFPTAICSAISFAPAAYAVLNLILVGFSIFINRAAFVGGLTPLAKFKGNSDTAVSVASIAAVVQCFVSFFMISDMKQFSINYYVVIVLLAFFANTIGKLFMVLRVKDNFKLVSSKGQKYAAKIYNNESVANQMMSGTPVDRPLIAYQHKTNFPSNFLKISYAPDPSEDLASQLAPITTVTSLIVAILYGILFKSFGGAVNALGIMTAISIPVSTLVAVNLPVRRLCKKLSSYCATLSGYPSIKQFCDSTALMIDANELFPRDSVQLDGIKTFEDYNSDESLLCGFAILKEANNPIAKAFDSVVAETDQKLPEVESVLYEDEIGLVGWINSERILVGSRSLMEKYNVETPAIEYEEKYSSKGRQVTYLARAGRLVAMFVTRYQADPIVKAELQRAETNGISFLVRTTDCNISNDLIAQLYNLFYRSIKVLPTGLGNVLKETQSTIEDSSRAYLITNGKLSSLARAVSGSVRIKHNISLAIVIQLISVILGILLTATLALYAGVGVLGSLEILLYALFWGAAAIIAPAIQKP